MKLYKLLLFAGLIFCMIAQVYAQSGQSPASDTYPDPAADEIKQFLEGPQIPDLSQKGKPPARSSLAKMEIGGTKAAMSQNYPLKADLFLDAISANGNYSMTLPQFLETQKADPNWIIVDIRPSAAYSAGHIENSMNVPVSDLVQLMDMIPADKKVAVYGDGDANAAFGVMALRVFGDRDAWILQGGVSAWQSAGMTVV